MERVAIITGAGSGVGRASTIALNRAGWSVTLAGRRSATLKETAAGADDTTRLLCVTTDVSDEHSVDALFQRAVERFGRVDLLFNNAGANAESAPFDAITMTQWNEMIAINLTGAFLCARAAFRQMKRQEPRGGRIVNNASIAAQTPRPHAAAYAASKHGVTGLTKSLSIEGRPFAIACGQIDIGNAATTMSAPHEIGALQPDGETRSEPRIDVRHVVDALLYMANLPLDANVPYITVMATQMPFAGRG